MAAMYMYQTELNTMLDCLIPSRVVTYRPRPSDSDPLFDGEFREAKRLTRRLERAYSAVCRRATSHVQVPLPTWSPPRLRGMLSIAATVNFVVVKAMHFAVPQSRVNVCLQINSGGRSKPVNLLLERGKPPASSDIREDQFSQFFHDKFDAVRQNTAGAPGPTFSTVRSLSSLVSFTAVCVDDAVSAIFRLPDKSSAAYVFQSR